MAARLKNPLVKPTAAGWFWVDPASRRPFVSIVSLDDLLDDIRHFFKLAGRAVPSDLAEKVEGYMADRLPPARVTGIPAGPQLPDYFEVQAAIDRVFVDSPLVDGRQACRRAHICLACPRHEYGGGLNCLQSMQRLRQQFGEGPIDGWLGLCTVLKVPAAPLAFIARPAADGVPSNCWMTEGRKSRGNAA